MLENARKNILNSFFNYYPSNWPTADQSVDRKKDRFPVAI